MSKIKKAMGCIEDNIAIVGLVVLVVLSCGLLILVCGWVGYALDRAFESNGVTTGVLVGIVLVWLNVNGPRLKG